MVPIAYTAEEVRQKFLEYIWCLIRHWDTHSADKRAALEGIAFSVLAMLDGDSAELPRFVVAPDPHPDDRESRIQRGEKWFPESPEVEYDISGGLHEFFHAVGATTKEVK